MGNVRLFILSEMAVCTAILHLALPMILAMLVEILYNLTDTFFIGLLNNHHAMAGVSVSMPIFLLTIALAGIFGNGAASYISRLLGTDDTPKAGQVNASAWYASAVLGVLITVVGLLFLPQIVHLLGAREQVYPYAYTYVKIMIAGSITTVLAFSGSQLLRAEGAAKQSMMGNLLGTGLNIVLDPLFILVFHMGVAGAAIATLIGNTVVILYFAVYYLKGKSLICPAWKYVTRELAVYAEIAKIGIPSSLNQLMMGIGTAFTFNFAARYGDVTVAAMGIVSRVISTPFLIYIGLAIGVQPLIGYSYGAGNGERLKQTLSGSILIACSLALFFSAVFVLFPTEMIRIFMRDSSVEEVGVIILRVYSIGLVFAALEFLFLSTLQAMGKAIPSLIVSLSRQGFLYIPALFIMTRMFGFSGMVAAQPVADIGTALIASLFVWHIIRKPEIRETKI